MAVLKGAELLGGRLRSICLKVSADGDETTDFARNVKKLISLLSILPTIIPQNAFFLNKSATSA
jgi:hypothetical protein